ncbi:GNAT family N-acetyltransferase [Hoeflea olei]|uniref:GCN5 family acetyltransferase n=1 Tax=Hoeflea olei TaxID=1480615 RepID=A0A1C1YPW6_9HYPH|nr:GNAT family N-acetyltransferase [Hoeflea olei]OCW55603.1 GCN5 family acetyltransferase [Hoeflea olei]
MDIRPATADDAEAIISLWHRGWHEAHAALVPEEILAYRKPDTFRTWWAEATDRFFVAVSGARPISFVSVKDCEVVKLYVGSAARGTGVAPALLAFAERTLAQVGVTEAELFCTAGNARAERFYLRNGWRLAETFDDALWTPAGVTRRVIVPTHRFRKGLAGQFSAR